MSAGEDKGEPFAESPSSRFTAVNEKHQPTIVVSMNGTSGNGAPRRSLPDERASWCKIPPPPKEKLSITASTSPTHSEEWISLYSPYGSGYRHMSTHAGPKIRKRAFSHRTKTGCMTCRRRKKNCDEARPECNNCLHAGFDCFGYHQRGQPNPDQKQAPIPLQSDYDKAGYTRPTFIAPSRPDHQREPLPGYRGQALRDNPHLERRINIDDDQPFLGTISSASTTSPEKNGFSASSFSGHTVIPITASSSAYSDRDIKSPYDRIGPLHDPTRQEGRTELDPPPSAQSSNLPPLLNPQMHADIPRASPQVAAQLAVSNLASANRPRTQKEEMLAGRHYFPFDKALVLERERCSAACWRFNNYNDPNNRASPEEQLRLFRDILHPVVSPPEASPLASVGRVGANVVVEAPFSCDYGYNITIGQDVAIGKNCTILDICDVVIGDRCIIGPNVNIYTATVPVDPAKRMGIRGPSLGRKIIIGSDCWIGGSGTILPGRTIGKGSTVGAGSIVTKDVPPYTVVCGNPARVTRGLYKEWLKVVTLF